MFIEWFLLFILILSIYQFIYIPLTFWKRMRVPYATPWPIFGNFLRFTFATESFFENIRSVYKQYPNDKILGIYMFHIPLLMLKDPDLINDINIKYFDNFMNHSRMTFDVGNMPIIKNNLFNSKDEKWRNFRRILSPSFTANKLRTMFDLILKNGEQVSRFLNDEFKRQNKEVIQLNGKNTFAKYTNDVIISTSFGVTVNSFENPENLFYVKGKEATKSNILRAISVRMPFFNKIFKINPVPFEPVNFLLSAFRKSLKIRRTDGIARGDMIDLLLEAQAKSKENSLVDASLKELSDDDIVAQAFIFFFAGYETTSATITIMFYELALNPHIQQKLFKEIKQYNSEDLTYETLMEMKYMNMIIYETLRKWPQGAPNRVCKNNFEIDVDGKTYFIKSGTAVFVPALGIHRDPKYYPNPDKFDPDRFNSENINSIKSGTFFPFGIGQRACIGKRLAIMELKVALYSIIKDFEVVTTKDTEIPITLYKKTISVQPNTSWIGFKRRSKL